MEMQEKERWSPPSFEFTPMGFEVTMYLGTQTDER
jgi:coenzyme PQQ precursor peptide PqqA